MIGLASLIGLSAAAAIGLILLLLPVLDRHVVGSITARSDHRRPTPHGGGAAVFVSALGLWLLLSPGIAGVPMPALAGLVALIALLGLWDDLVNLSVLVRLAVQAGVAALAIWLAAWPLPALWPLPAILVAGLAVFALLFAMNATNFIDGSDLITVAHAAPALGGFTLCFAVLDQAAFSALAALILGGLLGFAVFNRPPARLFLGDVGSLPLGFALGLFTLLLWREGHLATALAFIAYPALDAASTLVWRAARRVDLTEAHRDHAYQAARDAGWPASRVAGAVFVVQLAGAAIGLAGFHLERGVVSPSLAPLSLGMVFTCVGGLILLFRRRRAFSP